MNVKAKIVFIDEKRTFYNHYRPLIKINDEFYSCELMFRGKNSVKANDEIETQIIFLRLESVKNHLYKGENFELFEGPKKIGEGYFLANS